MSDRHQAARQIHYFTWMKWLFLLAVLNGRGRDAADVVTSCPEYFIAGQVNTVTCTVNQTSISQVNCAGTLSNVGLEIISTSGSVDKCSSVYPATSCVPQTTARTCFCANESDGVLTYQWNFVADQTHQGGNFSCKFCDLYLGLPAPQRVNSPNCSNIQFESPDRWLLFLLLLIPVDIGGSWVIYLYCCLGRATADKDWNGYKTSNLHFKKGDIISLLENEGSFWKGEINNQTGVFPKDFVHVRKNSGDVRTVEALHNWNKDNELTFKSGSTIFVRKQLETVWQGIQCCKTGWFPHSDVTLKKKGICWKQSDSDNMTMNSTGNTQISSRPLPKPSRLTSIERNSARDLPVPSPGRQPLPPISGRLEKL
ncbi:uncharacterized protein LOC112568895 isoform X2 [Pomacea canaliculata]|uniref:uncharacterized protein LOC112568895 isoform X2 n=1 Tax=Pomacea canaliculata TaxID=400727 RepID=UPI000D7320FB|nr:uncharacterized protein LOC112568895 isoform X2 [Pomacea canaliculata]